MAFRTLRSSLLREIWMVKLSRIDTVLDSSGVEAVVSENSGAFWIVTREMLNDMGSTGSSNSMFSVALVRSISNANRVGDERSFV